MSKDERKQSLRGILQGMGENSTIHGIPRIVSSRHKSVRIIWLCLFLGITGFLIFQLSKLFTAYYSWPMKTSVSLKFSQLQFPSVSFCNMNPIKKSMLYKASSDIQTIFNPQLVHRKVQKKRKKRSMSSDPKLSSLNDPMQYLDIDHIESSSDTNAKISPTSTQYATPAIMQTAMPSHNTLPGLGDLESSGESTDCINSDGTTATNCDTGSGTGSTGSESDSSYEYTSSSYTDWWDWYRESVSDSYSSSSSYSTYYDSTGSGYYSTTGYSSSYDYYNDDWMAPKDKWQDRVERFLRAFQNESKDTRYDLGHVLQDMLLSCSFATKVCYPSNFTKFQTSEYGNCYTIESEKFTTRRTGPLYGLWLTLNLESKEYMTNFADAYGIKLIIHEPGTFPFPAEEGITINPNYETTIGLRMIHISRLGPPHGDCDSGETFEGNFGVRYTVPACVKLCKQRKVLEECKCVPSDMDIDIDYEQKQHNKQTRTCDLENIIDAACVELVNLNFAAGLLDCFCKNPCKEIVYAKTVSGRHWPNDDYMVRKMNGFVKMDSFKSPDYFRQQLFFSRDLNPRGQIMILEALSVPLPTRNSLIYDLCQKNFSYNRATCRNYTRDKKNFDIEKFKDNFLRVIIYYEDLNYEIIKEDPLYDSFQFISDVGGTLGLCIGGSILSLFEFAQLLVEIIHFFRTKFTHKKSKVSDSMQELNIDMKIVEKVQIQNAPSEGGIFHPNYVVSDNYKSTFE